MYIDSELSTENKDFVKVAIWTQWKTSIASQYFIQQTSKNFSSYCHWPTGQKSNFAKSIKACNCLPMHIVPMPTYPDNARYRSACTQVLFCFCVRCSPPLSFMVLIVVGLFYYGMVKNVLCLKLKKNTWKRNTILYVSNHYLFII